MQAFHSLSFYKPPRSLPKTLRLSILCTFLGRGTAHVAQQLHRLTALRSTRTSNTHYRFKTLQWYQSQRH